MEVRCPQCHTPVKVGHDDLMSELVCVGCGGTFSLLDNEETVSALDGKPRTVGHFELLERIGAGSFGAVWRARDKEQERTVAVKIPRKGNLDAEESQRFLQEAQATAQLRHPNIVSVHEAGRDGDTLFIVNDFIRGSSLTDRLVDSRFTPQEAADMCAQIADGLEHAHEEGVIHRDLKPGNILIDMDGMPYIVDFGLARRDAGEVTMTLEGRVFGTPAYASPEQVRGDASQADRRSDIYSLGVVLFEMLTGERPFRGNVQMILQQVVHDDAPSPRSFNGNVPRELETVCLKCLEKSPGRRYQSAGALRDDLRRYLEGIPIHARPVGFLERGRKWIGRHPTVSLLVASVVLLAITVVAALTSRWQAMVSADREYARMQVDSVLNAEPQVVASVISTLDRFRRWTDPDFHELLNRPGLAHKHQYRANLALLPAEPERLEFVFRQLLGTEGGDQLATTEIIYGAAALREHRDQISHLLWKVLEDSSNPRELRFRAVLILAKLYDGPSSRSFREQLEPWGEFVTDGLLELSVASPRDFPLHLDAMRPVGGLLVPFLEIRVLDEQAAESVRLAATSFFGEYIGADFERLTSVALSVKNEQYSRLLPYLKDHQVELRKRLLALVQDEHVPPEEDENGIESERRAHAFVTLVHLGQSAEAIWPLLKSSSDMRLRTALIQSFGELQFPPELLTGRIFEELETWHEDSSILRALLLGLGEYPFASADAQQALMPQLIEAYENHPDSGTHSAIGWLLRRWGHGDELASATTELSQLPYDASRRWYVNREGVTMAVIHEPPVFLMGSPETEEERAPEERLHWRKIDRTFAISTTETTVSQFRRYANSDPDCKFVQRSAYGPEPDGPAQPVTWFQAAKYCRWLSEVEGIPEEQMCFPEISEIGLGMVLPGDYLQRTGYRLPSEGEWEYACRTGTRTSRFYGNSDQLVGYYGWFVGNCHDRTWPVGMLRPNGLGLFDVYGNVWEWCADYYGKLPVSTFEMPYVDIPKFAESKRGYILRGGSITNRVSVLRSSQRDYSMPYHNRNHNIGFRVARTMPIFRMGENSDGPPSPASPASDLTPSAKPE